MFFFYQIFCQKKKVKRSTEKKAQAGGQEAEGPPEADEADPVISSSNPYQLDDYVTGGIRLEERNSIN